MVFITKQKAVLYMGSDEKCALCDASISFAYLPMKEWDIDGFLCSKCYSKKLSEFYPGKHERVNLSK
jgi:hypothetical protein